MSWTVVDSKHFFFFLSFFVFFFFFFVSFLNLLSCSQFVFWMNLNWWQQLLAGLVMVLAIQSFKFGPHQAHLGVGRLLLRWTVRGAGLVASHANKPWLSPGASTPPSGRLAFMQNLISGKPDNLFSPAWYADCARSGKLSASDLTQLRSLSPVRLPDAPFLTKITAELVPDGAEKPADSDGFPGSIWVDSDFSVEDDTAPILVYLHGGGGVLGGPRVDLGFAYSLHKATGFRTLAFKYPLAPESPAPAAGKALSDAIAKLAGPRRERFVVVVGLSGGAHPIVQALLDFQARPSAVVMLAPSISAKLLPSHKAHEATDYFTTTLLGCMMQAVYPGGAPSPLERSWKNAANIPFYFQVGQTEMLVDDSKLAVAKLEEAGNKQVVLDVVPHVHHAFIMHQDLVPEANAALLRVREWIKERSVKQ